MVTTFAPSRAPIGTEQDRMAVPLICTVQAPHCAIPQANFVPVKPITSRNTQRSGVSGSMSICWDTPLTSIVITASLPPAATLFRHVDFNSPPLKFIRIIGFAPEASARIGASAEVLVWNTLEKDMLALPSVGWLLPH